MADAGPSSAWCTQLRGGRPAAGDPFLTHGKKKKKKETHTHDERSFHVWAVPVRWERTRRRIENIRTYLLFKSREIRLRRCVAWLGRGQFTEAGAHCPHCCRHFLRMHTTLSTPSSLIAAHEGITEAQTTRRSLPLRRIRFPGMSGDACGRSRPLE